MITLINGLIDRNKQRRFIAGGFAKKFKKITKKELKGVGNDYDKEYEPIKVAKVENIELAGEEVKLNSITEYNKENIEIFEGDRISSKANPNNNIVYYSLISDKITAREGKDNLPIISISLPTLNEEELTSEVAKFFTDNSLYYKRDFVREYKNWIQNELTANQTQDANINVCMGKFIFAGSREIEKGCAISLLYNPDNHIQPNNLIKELNNQFRLFLKNNRNIDAYTKKRLDKYIFNQKLQNAVSVQPLASKGFLYSNSTQEIQKNLNGLERQYYNAFENNVQIVHQDENGSNITEPITLAA